MTHTAGPPRSSVQCAISDWKYCIWINSEVNRQLIRGQKTPVTTPRPATEFGPGHAAPRIIPFQSTPDQAQIVFDRWHKDNLFSPGSLLTGAIAPMRQAFLFFWLFDTTVHVQYKGMPAHTPEDCQ
jgi:hypothetical protein